MRDITWAFQATKNQSDHFTIDELKTQKFYLCVFFTNWKPKE